MNRRERAAYRRAWIDVLRGLLSGAAVVRVTMCPACHRYDDDPSTTAPHATGCRLDPRNQTSKETSQ